ncbi:MAG: phosphoribosylformylglycinamidine cyclo-ligase [Deltaproteobacteria bacterium]|nr:phosphoribosylformylglycinamidine cyclo-ligase [Deltaproteobacteria bacterium]
MTTTYKDAGVDIEAGDQFVKDIGPLVQSTMRPEVVGSLGGFSGLFALDTKRYKNPLLVAATDGVGTKLKVANIVGNHSTVGIDLVAMCVNDLIVCGAEPLFFLDYFATSRLDPVQGKQVVAGIADGCRQAGCVLLGGETAEMPGFYKAGEYDLAGFSVGVVQRDKTLGSHRVTEGDILLGLASSGLHSNGFSLVRKVLIEPDPTRLQAPFNDQKITLGEEILRPTRIYVRLALELIADTQLHALAHITGGGLKENIPRVLPENLMARVELDSWTVPPIFDLIKTKANLDQAEMLKTFNLGIGLVAILSPDQVQTAKAIATRHSIDCWSIGQIDKRKDPAEAIQFVPPVSG